MHRPALRIHSCTFRLLRLTPRPRALHICVPRHRRARLAVGSYFTQATRVYNVDYHVAGIGIICKALPRPTDNARLVIETYLTQETRV
jgi:hypothetical protein